MPKERERRRKKGGIKESRGESEDKVHGDASGHYSPQLSERTVIFYDTWLRRLLLL
jgi:hypothetical protein